LHSSKRSKLRIVQKDSRDVFSGFTAEHKSYLMEEMLPEVWGLKLKARERMGLPGNNSYPMAVNQ